MPKSRRSSMQQAMLNMNKHIYSNEVRLLMECTEEELLPSQKSSYKSALDEYNRVNKYIADVQTGKIQMSNVPNSTISLVTDPNAVVRPKPVQKPNQNNDPDVIVIGESPAQQTKVGPAIPALPNVNNLTLPVLPDNISGQQIITFPQQVYNQLVNGQQSNVVKVGNQIFIRPIMPVAPQQNGAQGVSYSVNQSMIRPTSLLKRQVDLDADRKRLLASKNEMDSSGNWVPLDEFYYGKKEGDPTYVEDKGEYRFKCWYCSKMLYNNVKIMMHMQGHIDSEKQHNLDLSDLTQCKHCYKQFDTPFEMQTHIEKVHMYNSNVLMCRICEKDCDSRFTLTSHMRTNHNACEMPYICHLCGFRSSMYSDVVDHFKKKHDSSANLLCLYCLKAFNIKFISTGWGQTQNYYHHLLKHQAKNKVKKCQVCKLTFFNPAELKSHRQKDHLANVKGVIGMNSKYTTPDQVMIKVPEQGLQPKPIKSLNAPTVSKVRDNHLLLPRVVNDVDCLECKTSMSSVEHFKKYIQCSMCRFATSCSFAYANHMMGFHSGKMTTLSLNIPQEKPMEHVMYCMCGYASLYGNKIANHMVYCTKRTCYKDKPDVQIQEYDNKEMQDPRKKPGASLLDVLGLVKKPSSGEGDDINETNEDIAGNDDKPKEYSSSNDSPEAKSSTTDASEVREKSEKDKSDVIEITDEQSANIETDKNNAKSIEEKMDSDKDDGGWEDVISENSVSDSTDNVKNPTEDITESIDDISQGNDVIRQDSPKDNASGIKESESKLDDEQFGNSNDITEINSEEKKSADDQSCAVDSEEPMDTPVDHTATENKDALVIDSKTLDLPEATSDEAENDSETMDHKAATLSTPSLDNKESTSEEQDIQDAVTAMETEDTPSYNVDTTTSNTDKETEPSSSAEEAFTEEALDSQEDKETEPSSIAEEKSTEEALDSQEDKETEPSSIAEEAFTEEALDSQEDKETEPSSIAEEKSTEEALDSQEDKETEPSSIAEEAFTEEALDSQEHKETEPSSIAEEKSTEEALDSQEDKETESSSIAEEKSTDKVMEIQEDKVCQSEVPLNEASAHSMGTTADKEENITQTTDQTISMTSSDDDPTGQQSTEESSKPAVADTKDKPSINEASLETNPEEALQIGKTPIKFMDGNKITGETPTDENNEKDITHIESAIRTSGEQSSDETCPGTVSDHQTDKDPTKRQQQSESTSQQPNYPPQQQNQKDTSAESSSKPEDTNERSDDSHRRYSDDRSRAYDRERSNREHRDRERDRSYQNRNDYRDRSRDNHYDRDRKYDRDYDRHGRDRNRDYGYGNHSRDYRRDGYRDRDRDRDRDYDNRNYNRKGGNHRDRSGYY